MKKILLLFVSVLTSGVLIAQTPTTLETKIQVKADPVGGGVNTAGKSVAKQFKDGLLYYNAMPSTPAKGSAVKVIDSKDDKDYVVKTYKLKTKGIALELASYLQTTVALEQGQINVSVDLKTGDEYIIISAPIFQFSGLEATIAALDHPGTSYYEDGTKLDSYKLKNRLASDISRFVGTALLSKNGAVYADDRVNKIYLIDAPSYFDGTMKFVKEFDVPPEMIKIEAQIIEVEAGENFDFGLAWESWKEALPEEVNMEFNWDQNKNGMTGSITPDSWARNAAQMLRINGIRPKAMANFINYLVSIGKAKVLSRPTIVATNGQRARISNEDTISYSAYSGPSEILQKQTNTGLVLAINPIIGSDSITLQIEATIRSLLGFGTDSTPIINTRTTTSNVVLASGETFTLSGLRKDTITKKNDGIPILQSIPFLGYFFRHEIDVKSKKELIVMLKPTKVTADTGLDQREQTLLNITHEEVDAPAKSGGRKFVDRVILNKLD